MNTTMDNDGSSVGLVKTEYARIALPPEGFALDSGKFLPELTVAYERYGALSPQRDNVVLICHALSGDAHVAGYHDPADPKPGWWDNMVGPGKGIDTNRFHVICSNILGGCKGTTGPASVNPATGIPYGSGFPTITVGDMVTAQRLLLDHLGITQLAGVVGGSLGGMQVLEWAIRYPAIPRKTVCIASAVSLSAQALAFDIVGRNAILADPYFMGGDYYGTGHAPGPGLAQARMIGHITYLSSEMMTRKFGREKRDEAPLHRKFGTRFEVESYLHYQGTKFVDRFDANSYLHITEAMDAYDLEEAYGSLEKAFERVQGKSLVVALSSDWLFPPEESQEIAEALLRTRKHVSYCLLHAPQGHDAFLVDTTHLSRVVRTFLGAPFEPEAPVETTALPPAGKSPEEADDAQIGAMIRPGSRVLDLGCGDGRLLRRLAARHQTTGMGFEIDLEKFIGALSKGLDVFQGDIDEGLAMIPDGSFDTVILSETLQVVRKPRLVLGEMLRVARESIVSFPNFGCWTNRLRLGFGGRMPKSSSLPFEWYETPNIHLATLKDILDLCRADRLQVTQIRYMTDDWFGRWLVDAGLPNAGAARVLLQLTRARSA